MLANVRTLRVEEALSACTVQVPYSTIYTKTLSFTSIIMPVASKKYQISVVVNLYERSGTTFFFAIYFVSHCCQA